MLLAMEIETPVTPQPSFLDLLDVSKKHGWIQDFSRGGGTGIDFAEKIVPQNVAS